MSKQRRNSIPIASRNLMRRSLKVIDERIVDLAENDAPHYYANVNAALRDANIRRRKIERLLEKYYG